MYVCVLCISAQGITYDNCLRTTCFGLITMLIIHDRGNEVLIVVVPHVTITPSFNKHWRAADGCFVLSGAHQNSQSFSLSTLPLLAYAVSLRMTFVWHSCCVCSAVSHVCVACMNCSLWSLTEHLMKIDKTIVKLLEEKLSVIQGAQVRPPSRREPTCLMMPMPMMMLLSRDVVEQPHSKGVNRSDMFWSQGSLSVTKQFCD